MPKKSTKPQEVLPEKQTAEQAQKPAPKKRTSQKKPQANSFEEVFEQIEEEEQEGIIDDEEDYLPPLPNTRQRKEIREKEEFVKRVLEEDDFSPAKINFARKDNNKKESEFLLLLANAPRYNPDVKSGLSLNQVTERKEQGLTNQTQDSNAKTYKSIFFSHLFTFFNLLCFVVATALILVKSYDNLMFLIIMATNIIIGIVLEIKAKKSIEKLSLISSSSATVVREGDKVNIPHNEIVLDDVMYLENGRQICTDGIVLKGEIEVNEALLTGESVPVRKKAGDSLYGGSYVTSGSCYAKADKIGNANYIASLASFAKKYKKARSEILNSLKVIITGVGIVIVPIAAFLFYRNFQTLGKMGLDDFDRMQQTVTSTAGAILGMIPAGMFLLTSVALAASVLNLGKKNVLVQDVYCIEMLARVDMLCLDKTGTITDGTMRVSDVMELKNETGYTLNQIVGSFLSATNDNNSTALALAMHFGYDKSLKPVEVLPFSSQRKISAVSFEDGSTYILGAPEYVMREMGPRLERIINQKAKEGLRVLMLASAQGELKGDKLPLSRRPFAIISIEDHIREDAADTLGWFKENGVNIKIISGDNPITVSEVARRVGVPKAELFVSLEGKTAPEVVELASQYTVFGRVTPEQKRILVRALKAKGHTVAMTGDGVNDILALKEADCSVAIASGSEAARNVSHMVLQDNNFKSMPSVVHEGRRVVNNIQKSSSLYLMKTLFSLVVAVMVIFLVDASYPIQPKQLILLEFFVIGVPSFFLAFQTNKNRIEGRFLTNIVKKAFPAGFTLILSFVALFVYNRFIPLDETGNDIYTTLTVLIITFVGLMMLLKMCIPFDIFRAVLCICCALGCVGVMLAFPQAFVLNFKILDVSDFLLALVIVESSYFLVSLLTGFFGKIKVNSEKPSELDGKVLAK